MAHIGFIGLGNMGLPMASNLVKTGHAVIGFDVLAPQVGKLSAIGGLAAASVADAAQAEAIITMRRRASMCATSIAAQVA
jgi:3-hydroxyisobutyrate dehydrogenase